MLYSSWNGQTEMPGELVGPIRLAPLSVRVCTHTHTLAPLQVSMYVFLIYFQLFYNIYIQHTCLCLHEYLLKHFADFVLITLGPTQCAGIHESMRMYWIFWFLHTLFLNISAFLASFFYQLFLHKQKQQHRNSMTQKCARKIPKSRKCLQSGGTRTRTSVTWQIRSHTLTQSHIICMLCCLVCTEKAFLSSLRIRNVAALRAKQIKQTFCLYPE